MKSVGRDYAGRHLGVSIYISPLSKDLKDELTL